MRRRGQSSRDQTFPSMVRWMDSPTQRYSYGRFCCSHGTYVLVTLQSSLDHHHRTIGITIWPLAGSKCICCYARRRLRVCRSLVGNPSQVNREFRPAILDCRSAQRLPFSLANLPELSYLPANNIRARYERRRIILCCSIGGTCIWEIMMMWAAHIEVLPRTIHTLASSRLSSRSC